MGGYWGDFVQGDFVWGDFVLGGILSRGILSGGFCPGGFCPGGFCPRTILCLAEQGRDCDLCLTEDGNAFLYGARVIYKDLGISSIYKDLGISSKGSHVYYCNMEDTESSLGKDMAMKLLLALQGEDILERLKKWGIPDFAASICSPVEKIAYKKAMKVKDFPSQKVIDKFFMLKDDMSKTHHLLKWEYPNLKGLQEFCLKNLEWPEEYTASKVLSVTTEPLPGLPISTEFIKTSDQTSRGQACWSSLLVTCSFLPGI